MATLRFYNTADGGTVDWTTTNDDSPSYPIEGSVRFGADEGMSELGYPSRYKRFSKLYYLFDFVDVPKASYLNAKYLAKQGKRTRVCFDAGDDPATINIHGHICLFRDFTADEKYGSVYSFKLGIYQSIVRPDADDYVSQESQED